MTVTTQKQIIMKKNLIITGMTLLFLFAWTGPAGAQEPEKKKEKTEVAPCAKKAEKKSSTECATKEKKSEKAKKECDKHKTDATAVVYQCPMKCEGDKTYDKPGKCPTCGMELKKMEAKKKL